MPNNCVYISVSETEVLNSQDQACLLGLQSETKSTWRSATSGVPQGTVANTS